MMASLLEMNAARFLIREARAHGIIIRVGGSGGCQQRLFGAQIRHRSNHLDTNNPPTANQPSSYLKSFFSTLPAAAVEKKNEKKNTQQTKKENNNKKSPHSKLLRVCSDRNSNSHFAAIEGMCFFCILCCPTSLLIYLKSFVDLK